jgi:hypothetical protein
MIRFNVITSAVSLGRTLQRRCYRLYASFEACAVGAADRTE